MNIKSLIARLKKNFNSRPIEQIEKRYFSIEEALGISFQFPDGTKWVGSTYNGVKGPDYIKINGKWTRFKGEQNFK